MDAEKLAGLVNSLVIPDRNATASKVDAAATAKTLSTILEGGRDSIVGLVDMLVEPGKGDDSKVRYALHALAVRVGAARDEKKRQAFAEALASTLGSKRPRECQAFVIRQLQVVGGEEAAPALGKLLLDEELHDPAAQALLAIKTGAAAQFRTALPRATGKSRLTVVVALGTLRDAQSAGELRKLAEDRDLEMRLSVGWALANIGDAESVPLLLKATESEGRERVKSASNCLLLAERLLAAGRKAEAVKLYTHLRDKFTADHEAHIRDAALRGITAAK